MFSLYSDPAHQPRYNVLFILTGAGKLNYFGTKYLIEEMMEDSGNNTHLSHSSLRPILHYSRLLNPTIRS